MVQSLIAIGAVMLVMSLSETLLKTLQSLLRT
jgi:hypothetical protein